MITINGTEVSVAAYFLDKYNITLEFPMLPPVNVGGRRQGSENWLPIEVCKVTRGQLCHGEDERDSRETTRLTAQDPSIRKTNIEARVREAKLDNDPYMAAFGLVVDHRFERVTARVLDAPDVQYENVSEQPLSGQWNLKDKKFVDGVHAKNWGIIVLPKVEEHNVKRFLDKLTAVEKKHRLDFSDPVKIDQKEYHSIQLETLITFCFEELKRREDSHGAPQLLMVVKQNDDPEEYGRIKYTSDIVLGLPSQCIQTKHC